MVKLVVTGAAGRMGQRIIALASKEKDLKIVGEVDMGDSLEAILPRGDVLIDFSSTEATLPNLQIAAKAKKAVVIGTTGHTPEQKKAIEKIASEIPIVVAPNMSLGVNVMWKILAEAARALGEAYPVSVREVHHVHKKDKPSGTALEIVRVLSEALGIPPEKIPVESVREGEVVGDHSVVFCGPEETLEITHRASSRDTFALGSLRAASWIVGKPNGLYTMADVLGLR